jgi:hypothetical protein
LEKEIEAKLVNLVACYGGLCLKWVCPGWAGVPDRIVLLPGGRAVFVELKRPKGGELSARQLWWGKKLTRLGFSAWVIWNTDDLEAFEDRELGGVEP